MLPESDQCRSMGTTVAVFQVKTGPLHLKQEKLVFLLASKEGTVFCQLLLLPDADSFRFQIDSQGPSVALLHRKSPKKLMFRSYLLKE